MIVSVASGGPADQAGLQGFKLVTRTLQQGPYRYEQSSIDTSTADLIQSVDGQPVRTADDLLTHIERSSLETRFVWELSAMASKP
ncbi:MAG: hypothetical protein R3C56_20570 [Pirellulaceae bacterium]